MIRKLYYSNPPRIRAGKKNNEYADARGGVIASTCTREGVEII